MSCKRLFEVMLAVAGLLSAGCGGSSGTAGMTELSPAPMPVEDVAPVIADAEGFVVGGVTPHTATPLLPHGDNAADASFVSILAFDLTGIGEVELATLTLHRATTVGDPWSMGPLVLDHIDGGGLLDAADATDPPLAAAIHELTDEPLWILDVTAAVQADIAAGRAESTFRLRFEMPTNGDATQDVYRIVSSKHINPDVRPTLLVSHVAP